MVRVFIAVELSEEQKDGLRKLEEELQKVEANVKYIKPEKMHLTLRFLGEIAEEEVEKVEEGCKLAVKGFAPFEMSLTGTGVFPSLDYIKIIWAGVESGKTELIELAKKINELVTVGKKDSREFSPHITLGRVKWIKDKEKLIEKIKEFSESEFGSCAVNEIKVMKSELGEGGPTYSDLHTIRFL